MELLENLKQYHEASGYDCNDIAEKLIELAGLEDDGRLGEELLNALYQIQATAQNPYNSDYYRVLYNVLLAITSKEG
ncbi:hypothetical protein D3Z52_02470 [Clostridiaceae bacterium]|nr:hypothetical protein [Clostridiaceae bacterium]